jgi:hypothetical protein
MSNGRRLRLWPYSTYRDFQHDARNAAATWFAEQNLSVDPRRPYVLGRDEDWTNNLILPEVRTYFSEEQAARAARGEGFSRHRHAHSGLSSQAMLFNLIGPLIARDDLEPLVTLLQQCGYLEDPGPYTVSFEYEDRSILLESSQHPTSMDLVLRDATRNLALFVECKFTEKEFGRCSLFGRHKCDGLNPSGDFSRCYLHNTGRRYSTLLDKYGFLDGPLGQEDHCLLAHHYQFFRCVLFALEHGRPFLLLTDARSPVFHHDGPDEQRGLMPFLLGFVPEQWRSQIGIITIQDIAGAIRDSGRHEWIGGFERKYGLANGDADIQVEE